MYIEVKNAVKKYGKGEAMVYALNSANLEIEESEICVILGPSGSGKSTLLNVLGGLDSLDSGSVKIAGKEITGFGKKQLTEYRRSDVGFVFQFYNLIPDLTVRENIEVVSDISSNPLNAEKIMEAFGINQYKHRFPRELSGGQQQRTAIGRALIKNPKILLCDELTGALDSKSSSAVLKYIENVNKEFKTTIIIITHTIEALVQDEDNINNINSIFVSQKDFDIISSNALFDNGDASYDGPSISEILKTNMELYKDDVAIASMEERITYGDLKIQTENFLSALIQKVGRKPARIALLMDKSPKQIVVSIACMCAGISYMPLETELPKEVWNKCIANINAEAVVVLGDYMADVEGENYKVLNIADIVFDKDIEGSNFIDDLDIDSEVVIIMHAVNGLCIANSKTNQHLLNFQDKISKNGSGFFLDMHETIRKEYCNHSSVIVKSADIVFEGEILLDAGNCPIRLFQAESPHTDDATLVHVIDEKILFIGDANCGEFPSGMKDKRLVDRFVAVISSVDADRCLEGHWTPDTPNGIIEDVMT